MALPGSITMASVRPVLPWQSISSTRGTVQVWGGGDAALVSLVNVTCIPRQCLVLGWLGDGFWVGDQDGEWERALPAAPVSPRSFQLPDDMGVWSSVWMLVPDVQSSKSLDLIANDMIVVAVNQNSRLNCSNWVQRPLQEIKKPLGLH